MLSVSAKAVMSAMGAAMIEHAQGKRCHSDDKPDLRDTLQL